METRTNKIIKLADVFEPHERFHVANEVSVDHVLFIFADEMNPVMVLNSGDEAVKIHKKTKLRQPELDATDEIQNNITLKSGKSPKLTNNKDARYDLKVVKVPSILVFLPKQRQSSLK